MRYLWWWVKRLLVGPANGRHANDSFSRKAADEVWDLPEGYDDWSPQGDWGGESFPIACPNGCPEGYLGRHKFSCSRLRETRADPLAPGGRPYVNPRVVEKVIVNRVML